MAKRRGPTTRGRPVVEESAWPHGAVFQPPAPIPRGGGVGGEWVRWIGGLVIAAALGWFALDNKTAVLVERVDQNYRGLDFRLRQIEDVLRITRP